MFFPRVSYSLSLTFVLMLIAGCDRPTGSGRVDGIELGQELSLHLENIAPQGMAFDAERLEPVHALFYQPPQGLDSLRVYTARAKVAEGEEAMDFRIGLLPLRGDFAGAYLALAIGSNGIVYRVRLWGVSDPQSAWENFWRQFEYRNPKTVLNLSTVLSDSAADQYWIRLKADMSQEGRLLQAMYEHQLLMRNNSYLIRRTMVLTGNGEVPEPSWFQHYAEGFKQLESMAENLKPLIGKEAASQYINIAKETKALLEPLAISAHKRDADKMRNAIKEFRQRTCVACHNIEDHNLGKSMLDAALYDQFNKHGARQDIYRIGHDVWPVPGEEENSQKIASTIKAILLLLGNT